MMLSSQPDPPVLPPRPAENRAENSASACPVRDRSTSLTSSHVAGLDGSYQTPKARHRCRRPDGNEISNTRMSVPEHASRCCPAPIVGTHLASFSSIPFRRRTRSHSLRHAWQLFAEAVILVYDCPCKSRQPSPALTALLFIYSQSFPLRSIGLASCAPLA